MTIIRVKKGDLLVDWEGDIACVTEIMESRNKFVVLYIHSRYKDMLNQHVVFSLPDSSNLYIKKIIRNANPATIKALYQ